MKEGSMMKNASSDVSGERIASLIMVEESMS
jgi:hypothetical protein